MSRRILVAETSEPVVASLRRGLTGTGLALDAVAPADAVAAFVPDRHLVALLRGGEGARALAEALRAVEPLLPLVALFFDEDEAEQHGEDFESDGALVGPLTGPAVAGACRMAEKLLHQRRKVRVLEEAMAQRVRGDHGLELVKRLFLIEVRRSKRYGFPLALALVAVDRFAEVQAKLGKPEVPRFLSELLGILTGAVRDIDLVAPFAGDRFVVLMPHTRSDGALKVARRLVARVHDRGAAHGITASAGLAGHEGGGTVSFGALVKRAAEALNRARGGGGDRAEAAEPPRRDRISMG